MFIIGLLILKYKSLQLSYEAPFQIIIAGKESFACSYLKKKQYFYLSAFLLEYCSDFYKWFFLCRKKKQEATTQQRDKDKTNTAVITSKQNKGKKAEKEEELKSLPRPIRYTNIHWFPIPISIHLPVHRETRMSRKVSFKWELVCLYSLYCSTECLFHYIGQQRSDRRAYRKQVSGYLGGQIRVGSGHRLRLFDCARDALGQYGQLRTLMLVAVVTNPACARCETTCFHCHCMTQRPSRKVRPRP